MREKNEMGHPARWWIRQPNGRIRCELCPRYCTLSEGQRGFCFVRQNQADELILTTYGRSSGFCIDPIEKKPLFHFFPGTAVLSFGTAGCNLGCKFCQNWSISKATGFDRLQDHAEPHSIALAALEHGCTSVAFTYNDPVIFAEYAIATAQSCQTLGIKTVAVSAGYVNPEPAQAFFASMDATNIDLKSFRAQSYKKICGGHLQPVLDTLQFVYHKTNTWLEITTLIIPGINDSDREIQDLAEWVCSNLSPQVPVHFTAFHPDWKMADRPATPLASLQRIRQTARNTGLLHVYTGNVLHPEGECSNCSQCGLGLIARKRYEISSWNLTADSCCPSCGSQLPGHFATAPGTWGSRRRTIAIV